MKSFLSKKILGLATILAMSQSAMAVILEAFTDADTVLAGTRFPVYVSARGEGNSFDTEAAAGQSYAFSVNNDVAIYQSKDSNQPTLGKYLGKVGDSGVDTLWLELPLEYIQEPTVPLRINVGITDLKLTAIQPGITFANIKSMDEMGNPIGWEPTYKDPDTQKDGSMYFQQTNTEVALALVAVNPITMEICKECNFEVILGAQTSAGVTAEDTKLANGITLVRLRSQKDFETETASITVCLMRNSSIHATYGNMHFLSKPSALPQLPTYKAQPMPAAYTVMDMQGKILHKGITHSTEINMSMFAPGSYIVRIGSSYRKVNVR